MIFWGSRSTLFLPKYSDNVPAQCQKTEAHQKIWIRTECCGLGLLPWYVSIYLNVECIMYIHIYSTFNIYICMKYLYIHKICIHPCDKINVFEMKFLNPIWHRNKNHISVQKPGFCAVLREILGTATNFQAFSFFKRTFKQTFFN